MGDILDFLDQNLLWLAAWVLLWSLAALGFYGADKRRAREHRWRVPEAALIALAWVGGGPGALLAMEIFRHKTRHLKFKLLVPLSCLLWLGLILYLAVIR